VGCRKVHERRRGRSAALRDRRAARETRVPDLRALRSAADRRRRDRGVSGVSGVSGLQVREGSVQTVRNGQRDVPLVLPVRRRSLTHSSVHLFFLNCSFVFKPSHFSRFKESFSVQNQFSVHQIFYFYWNSFQDCPSIC